MPRPVVNEKFFSKWSSEMAYILGFIAADGCLVEHGNGYHGLDITSKDKNLLILIKNIMQAGHKIGEKTRAWHLQVRNARIYKDLLSLGLKPRKSKTMLFPKVPKPYMPDFVRGYFDGDGGITVWREPRWRRTWQIRVTFSSGSRNFLKRLHKRLLALGAVNKGRVVPNKRAFELCLSIEDSLGLYSFMYKNNGSACLSRKKQQFENFIKLKSKESF